MLAEYLVRSRLNNYRQQVDAARCCIEQAAAKGPMIVAVSLGKDSVALLDLAIETLGRVEAMRVTSSYALPGGGAVLEYFQRRCMLHEIAPRLSLEETIAWLQNHGLGIERTKNANAGKKRKTDVALEWVRSHGYAVELLGMRAEESRGRRQCFRIRGLLYRAHGLWIGNPLGWWSARDTWAYIASRGLPYHPLYDCETHGETRETLRNSGWLTVPRRLGVGPGVDSRVAWLRAHYPEQYHALVTAFPSTRSLA